MTSKAVTYSITSEKIAKPESVDLPIRGNLTLVYTFSLVVALIVGGVSVAGILYPTQIYPTDEFLQTFVPTDIVKLFIGLPILLGSMWLAWRGRLIGLLFWPGALFYVVYSYLICVFALPLGWMLLLHLVLVMVSFYTLNALLATIDGEMVQRQLTGKVPERLAGGILTVFGFSFLLLATGVIINSIINLANLPITELALQKADFLVTPTWLIGGVLLWRRNALGYVVGIGLLFQSSMLMISLLVIILLKPILNAGPFVLSDFVYIFVFSLTCFVPLILFTRGVLSVERSMKA